MVPVPESNEPWDSVVTAHAWRALAVWRRLRAEFSSTGLWPVILGKPAALGDLSRWTSEFFVERAQDSESPKPDNAAGVIRVAQEYDLEKWRNGNDWHVELSDQSRIGKWPRFGARQFKLNTHLRLVSGSLIGSWCSPVSIGLFRVEQPWQIFAKLCYDCDLVPPEVHCATHMRWSREYDSELVSVIGAEVQCVVGRAPQSVDAAMKLAKEQFDYCPDLVWQGLDTISALAAKLIKGKHWYFWWD